MVENELFKKKKKKKRKKSKLFKKKYGTPLTEDM